MSSSTSLDIIIIGKIPPPIGGVTIHVKRLLHVLDKNNIRYSFLNLNEGFFNILKALFLGTRQIHLHTSNVYVRFLASLLSIFSSKRLFITYHGNIGRYGRLKNTFDKISIYFCTIPIVLNEESLKKAQEINSNSILISAFIPPTTNNNSTAKFAEIEAICNKYKTVFATNAFNVSFDKKGNEIYGISSLVKVFNKNKDIGLIISDPSGNYRKFLENKSIPLESNIKFITYPHSFVDVLTKVDGLIRATTTDGDSLSIKEAIYLGKLVICTDCVDRHYLCNKYPVNDYDKMMEIIEAYKFDKIKSPQPLDTSDINVLLNLYRN